MTDLAKARRKAREWTLQFLFSIDVDKNSLDELKNIELDRFWNMMEASEEAEEIRKYPKSKTEAIKKITGIFENITAIDAKIVAFASNWTIDRMAVVDRNIIRLGAYEILFCDEIPPKVSINEAIEMAKEFADKDSTKFINGILDRIKREAE